MGPLGAVRRSSLRWIAAEGGDPQALGSCGRRSWSRVPVARWAGRSPRAERPYETALRRTSVGGTHHAFPDRGKGFCVFNDVAVAVRTLSADGVAGRFAVLDLDVHQRNGTAAIFEDDDAVFTLAVHGENNFTFTKEVSDLDLELP